MTSCGVRLGSTIGVLDGCSGTSLVVWLGEGDGSCGIRLEVEEGEHVGETDGATNLDAIGETVAETIGVTEGVDEFEKNTSGRRVIDGDEDGNGVLDMVSGLDGGLLYIGVLDAVISGL